MKLKIQSDVLQKKLNFINHAISSKNQLPILQNVLLETKTPYLILKSTDLEIAIETKVLANIEEEGRITIPVKPFTELIQSLPQETILVYLEEGKLYIKSKKTKSSFQTISAEEYPQLYEEKGEQILLIKKEEFITLFSTVVFAVAQELSKPAMLGVLINKTDEGVQIVATDGYRLSLKKTIDKTGEISKKNLEKPVIIPSRIIREVMSVKEGEDVKISLSEKNNQVLFEEGESVFISRIIDATFPAFDKILPSHQSTQITFDAEEFYKAVKICSIFARDTGNIVRLKIEPKGISISAQTASLGENTVEVEGKLIGEANEIAFNAKFLLDLFSHINAEELVFEMTGPLNPGVFRIKDNPSFLHLIMPIKVQS